MTHNVMTYRETIEVQFEVSREFNGWQHDQFCMPHCLAGWLDRCCFDGVVTISVDVLIWGQRGGRHGNDDDENYRVLGARVGATPLPVTVCNCSLRAEWGDELERQVNDAADEACYAIH